MMECYSMSSLSSLTKHSLRLKQNDFDESASASRPFSFAITLRTGINFVGSWDGFHRAVRIKALGHLGHPSHRLGGLRSPENWLAGH